MNIVYERCAGLDVHKRSVTACASTPDAKGQRHKECESFSTMTPDVLRLRQWLKARNVTHVAMEATGVYWQPIYSVLEGHFELLLVNAQHIKAVPGRKTDVKDAEWLADLLQHGLLRSSFVPPASQRQLREVTRYRTSLIEERSRAVNRLQKILEGANIKLASVASEPLGSVCPSDAGSVDSRGGGPQHLSATGSWAHAVETGYACPSLAGPFH
jgi:transposase